MIKRGVKLSEEILKIAFEDFGSVSMDYVRDNREIHKAEAVRALDDNARKDKINSLANATKFTKAELQNLYNWTQATTDSFEITIEQHSGVIIQFCPFWKDEVSNEISAEDRVGDLRRELWTFFKLHDKVEGTLLSFDGLVFGLSVILKGTIEERWEVCTQLSTSSKERITLNQLIKALDLLLRMYNRPKPKEELESFIGVLFDKVKVKKSDTLSLDYVQKEIIEKPLLLEYFNLDPAKTTASPTISPRSVNL